jgi:hypothetical protein
MPTKKKDKPFPADPEVVTFRYRGPDRRDDQPEAKADVPPHGKLGDVKFDAKGNPVLHLRADEPRRRKDDDTIDLLKRLELESLALADDDAVQQVIGYDPYGRDDEPS